MIRFRPAVPTMGALLLVVGPLLFAAHGETLPLTPPLEEALPWADTPQGVKTTASVLLNPTAIVPAGAVVRTFYVRPSAGDDPDGPRLISSGDSPKEAAYSRAGGGVSAADSQAKKKLNDIDLAIRAAHQTVWPNIASFKAALALLGSSDLRLVYQAPGAADLSDQVLAPVEGLILCEKEGTVVVGGVIQGSNAARAGFAPGDRIDSFNDSALRSLTTFVDLYAQARSDSTISKPKPYLFRVRHAGVETPVEIAIRPPPSLGGSLLDQ